jgi:hypothetical protein
MGGFEHVDTAAAIRDIIKTAAEKVVANQSPGPNYGRVISVNLASLTATVWFPGDDSPITVNMFANNLPQQWHDQFDDGTGTVINTSTTGYGSIVAVETLNGKQYITEVLSGSQFAFDQRALDLSLVTQEATDIMLSTPKDLVGTPSETFISCHLTSSTLVDGQAINFGPFLKYDGTQPGVGSFDITVTWGSGCKSYNLVTSPLEDFDHPGNVYVLDQWMRILPSQTANSANTVAYDFDIDVCVKKTLYGNIDDFTSNYEMWFRFIRRDARIDPNFSFISNPSAGSDVFFSMRSTSIQRGRAVTGRQLFMQYVDISPPSHHGYLGFHDARHKWHDTDNDSIYDDFGRVTTNGFGRSDSTQTWGVFAGATSAYSTNGTDGVCAVASNNLLHYILDSVAEGPTLDIVATTWIEVMPTGANAEFSIMARRTDASNFYQLKCNFTAGGTITASMNKTVAGVFSVIGTDVTGVLTFTTFMKIKVRARLRGSTLQLKIWKRGTDEPLAWTETTTDSSLPLTSGNSGCGVGFGTVTGNTNTKPYIMHVDEYRADMQGPNLYLDAVQWRPGPWRSALLRLAHDIQRTWTLDGTWTWTGSNLSWTGTIFLNGVGHHRNGLAQGYYTLTMPQTGDKVVIAGNTSYTMGGSPAIPLNAGDSLYVSIPPATEIWQDLSRYLFIVRSADVSDYQLPEWAVLIASHNQGSGGQSPSLRLGNGDHLDNWRGATLINGWTGTARYRRESNQIVRLQGQPGGNAKTSDIAFNLPVGFRPGFSSFHSVVADGVWGFITIGTNGDVTRQAGGVTAYMALDGITFVAEG